jgi:hypothetical protein
VSRRSRRREAAARRQAAAHREAAARREARQQRPPVPAPRRQSPPGDGAPPRGLGGPLSSLGAQLVLLAAVFVLAVLVAELFGAANLGVAFGVGQIAFAIGVVYLILRR